MEPNFCDNRRSDYCKLILSLEFVVLSCDGGKRLRGEEGDEV